MANKLPTAVLLAGGKSNRMGSAKGLLSLPGGKTWLGAQVEALLDTGVEEVVVVLGYGSENYRSSVPELKHARIVINPSPERGQFSSLQAGISSVATGDVFVLPLDVPCPGKDVWRAIFGGFGPETQAIMPVHEGRGGHPVLLARNFVNKLAAIAPDSEDARLDAQLHGLSGDRLSRVSVVDARVTMNINTSVDWERFLAERGQ